MKRMIDKQSKEVQRLRIAAAMQANGVELEPGMHLKGRNETAEKIHHQHRDGFQCMLAALKTINAKQL